MGGAVETERIFSPIALPNTESTHCNSEVQRWSWDWKAPRVPLRDHSPCDAAYEQVEADKRHNDDIVDWLVAKLNTDTASLEDAQQMLEIALAVQGRRSVGGFSQTAVVKSLAKTGTKQTSKDSMSTWLARKAGLNLSPKALATFWKMLIATLKHHFSLGIRTHHSLVDVAAAVTECAEGGSYAEIAKRYNTSPQNLRKWCRRVRDLDSPTASVPSASRLSRVNGSK